MATRGEVAPCSPEGLICPLCLDIFEEATHLTCRHTFCRKCLKRYDASHLDRDHIVCPLCRSDTKLQENRVEGLPANVTVNGLVDDYHGNTGGLFASLEDTPNCTACKVQEGAVSYCTECRYYMCTNCHNGHQQLTSLFEHHNIVSVIDVSSGKINITQHPERCQVHKQETKDMFCEICKVYICFKCVIVAHRDHQIKNHYDFEKELQLKVDRLVERCKARKIELEKNIQNTEMCRQEVHEALQKLEADVRDTYEKKARQLKKNERLLLEELQSLKKGFDDDLDILKAKDRQRIKSIVSSVSLVANDRLGCLEADSLTAHCLLCDELEHILNEVKDDASAGVISRTAQKKVFQPADISVLQLGKIGQPLVSRTFDLRGNVWGITAASQDTVVIGYGRYGAVKVDTKGNTSQHLPQDGWYFDLAHQTRTGNTVILQDPTDELRIYSPDGSYMQTKKITNCDDVYSYCPMISSNSNDEIIIANRRNCIMIYDPSISTQLCSITTRDAPRQAFETRSGAIIAIASTCNNTYPYKVTAYDRSGRVGDTLTADPGEYLYAAVDSQDRIYVASVNQGEGKAVIKQYKMDGLKFRKVCQFEELKLALGHSWCYMVSLSCDMLAFTSGNKLHFIEVQPL